MGPLIDQELERIDRLSDHLWKISNTIWTYTLCNIIGWPGWGYFLPFFCVFYILFCYIDLCSGYDVKLIRC